jgi:iron complex outermembrane receptor protein
MILFEEPVISAAAKHPQAARNAPSAVTVITREEIRRFGYRSLAEALRSVRGFYGTYDRNYSYVGVRGFLRPGDFNDRILLLVNGHTYNDDIYQTAYLGPEFGIDMESIDHIEVIRGPGSALYGGNALFAVINVVTLNAAGAPGVRPLVETGSYGRKRGYGSVGHEFTNGEVYTSGSVLDVDGHEDLFYREFATARHNNGFAHEVDGERAFNYFVSARYGDFRLQGGVNRREKHIPTGSYGTEFNDPDTMTTDGRQFTELSYSRDVLPRVGLTARVFYDGVDYQGVYVTRSGRQRVKNQDIAPSHWMGSELRGRWDAFTNNSITTGVEVTYHPTAVLQNFDRPTGTRYLDVERSYEAWGIYAQDEWALRPNLTLVGGLRFDSYYNRLRELSPRLALIWSPLDTTTLKLLWGRAFRPPNLFEQFYATPALGYLANGQLESEKITTYEAVLEQEIGRWAQGLVALYRYDIHNLIDQTRVGDLLQYQNLDSVTAQGAEFELRVPLPRSAWLRTSYAIQEARLDDGRLLSNSPKHLGSAGLLVPLPARFQGAVDLVVVGPRRTLARRRLGTVTLVDLNLRAPPVRGFTLSGGLYNILDQKYFDPGGAEHRQDRIQQDGLTFRVQLEYAF